jgi:mannose-6-phosphate isomerase-like protein (cupin superfamily)
MNEPTVLHIDDIEGAYGGVFKPVGSTLGVTAFGVNVHEYQQGHDQYPEHDHAGDGQEEVFLAMRGGGEIEIDGERFPLDSDHIASVPAGTNRKVWPGPDGIRLVVVGGVPAGPYQAPDVSKLGEPDPMAAA